MSGGDGKAFLQVPIARLASPKSILCPACSAPIATLTIDGVLMSVDGTYLTEDGDAIPGVPDQVGGLACIAFANVGRCPGCHSEYWLLEVKVHEAGTLAVLDLAEDEPEWSTSWWAVGRMPDGAMALWAVHEHQTDAGTGYSFHVGPMLLPSGSSPRGDNGISACGGGDFWAHAAATMADAAPQIEATLQEIRVGGGDDPGSHLLSKQGTTHGSP